MFSIEYFNGAIIIAANGVRRINFLNVEKIKNLVVPLLRKSGDKLLLDFEEITFIDSKAFQVLKNLSKVSDRYEKSFRIINVGEELQEIFDLMPDAKFLIEEKPVVIEEKELELVEI